MKRRWSLMTIFQTTLVLAFSLSSSSFASSTEFADDVAAGEQCRQSLLDIAPVSPRYQFPDISTVDEHGRLPHANDIPATDETVLQAYAHGAFYYQTDDKIEGWFIGRPHNGSIHRGTMDIKNFTIPKTLQQTVYRMTHNDPKAPYKITLDRDFEGVISGCQDSRRNNERNWLNDEVKKSFIDLHRRGFAHSVEVWDGNRLVGGTYGIFLNGIFFTESMFTLQPPEEFDAQGNKILTYDSEGKIKRTYSYNSAGVRIEGTGRIAVLGLLAYLKTQNVTFTDTQTVTENTKPLGADYIPWAKFDKRRADAKLADTGSIFNHGPGGFEIDLAKIITPEHLVNQKALEFPFR